MQPTNPSQPIMQQSQMPCSPVEDEIDLSEIFHKIGRQKRFILGVIGLSILAVFAFGVLWMIKNPPLKDYGNVIRFNFTKVSQGKYPNGQRFTRNDIISPAVLVKVYAQNQLNKRDISLQDFEAAIEVSPYAPNQAFISTKYGKLLSNRKLSQAEIAALNKKYEAELAAAQSRFAKISFLDLKLLGISQAQIDKVLHDIPRQWSLTEINELGVLDLDIPGGNFFNPALVKTYEYIQAVQYLKDSSQLLANGLKALSKDSIGTMVRDPQTGLKASDILARLNNLNNFSIDPLIPLVSTSGVAHNLQEAATYAYNKIQQLQDRVILLQEQQALYQTALKQYQQTTHAAASGINTSNGNDNGIVQYGSDFLNKLTELVEKQKDTVFRQQLLQKGINLGLKVVALKAQALELKRALSKFEEIQHDGNSIDSHVRSSVDNKLKAASAEMVSLIKSYRGILQVRNRQMLGHTGSLYEQAMPQILVHSDLSSRIKKLSMIAAGVGVLALFITIMIALVLTPTHNKAA